MHAQYLMHMAYMIPGHLEDGIFFLANDQWAIHFHILGNHF